MEGEIIPSRSGLQNAMLQGVVSALNGGSPRLALFETESQEVKRLVRQVNSGKIKKSAIESYRVRGTRRQRRIATEVIRRLK